MHSGSASTAFQDNNLKHRVSSEPMVVVQCPHPHCEFSTIDTEALLAADGDQQSQLVVQVKNGQISLFAVTSTNIKGPELAIQPLECCDEDLRKT